MADISLYWNERLNVFSAPTVHTSTTCTFVAADGLTQTTFTGSNFLYGANGVPVNGTITSVVISQVGSSVALQTILPGTTLQVIGAVINSMLSTRAAISWSSTVSREGIEYSGGTTMTLQNSDHTSTRISGSGLDGIGGTVTSVQRIASDGVTVLQTVTTNQDYKYIAGALFNERGSQPIYDLMVAGATPYIAGQNSFDAGGNRYHVDMMDGPGNDTFTGNPARDFGQVNYATATSGISASLLSNTSSGPSGSDTFVNIRGLVGSNFNDALSAGETDYGLGGGAELSGMGGNDLLTGGSRNDVLSGGAGADVLVGMDGDDLATLGDGNDYFYAGARNDVGAGGSGIDVLLGEAGDDLLFGGDDQDYLFGGDGDDALNGDGFVDVLIGGLGNDAMTGDEGGDYFYGEDGNDTADGGAGNDIFVMATGNDIANGDDGQDYFYMGAGDDVMNGGAGVDVMLGEAGNDTFNGGLGVDYLFLGPGGAGDNDTVIIDKANTGVQVVYGFEAGGANDVIRLVGTGFTSVAQLQANITDFTASGGFCVLTLDDDTLVWLIGVAPLQLTAADFEFA